MRHVSTLALLTTFILSGVCMGTQDHPSWSGVYPHLAMYNDEGECGVGAVVPWAGKLWVITYGPHRPEGSSDKLYSIDENLSSTIHPESIGGTHANRMIHTESKQLFIGPYVIDDVGKIRAIPSSQMIGRLTGNARHLTDPENKIYFATMEEGIYEVDVQSLEVKTLFPDSHLSADQRQAMASLPKDLLPGYHGKGLYSAGDRLIYANNGQQGKAAQSDPTVPSGVLAQWSGKIATETETPMSTEDAGWSVVRRNQFTDVVGPGGISGNKDPKNDPVWSIGWDAKSLILMMFDNGQWHTFRLPKTSNAYDGAHGWNTEWPRIRKIGEADDLLMTMHGLFWKFPKSFSAENTSGIAARSSYLKVVGDFCRWQDQIVFGCDDTAAKEFLNKRAAKDKIAAPQSHSNLWFVAPEQLSQFGPATGAGAVWMNEDIASDTVSDPFLFSGFERRALHLSHFNNEPTELEIQVDRKGDGNWEVLQTVKLGRSNPKRKWIEFEEPGAWVRLKTLRPMKRFTAWFAMSNQDNRTTESDPIFAGLAELGDTSTTGGIVRSRAKGKKTLQFAATTQTDGNESELGYYELTTDMKLVKRDDAEAHQWMKDNAAISGGSITADNASLIFTDDDGKRYRFPWASEAARKAGLPGNARIIREVVTERDLLHCGGTFYELPAQNAGGVAKVRPIASHAFAIQDFCSHRGLLIMSGVNGTSTDNHHLIKSDDGKTALWAGAIDDLWRLGKPTGVGGPWKDTKVKVYEFSDPFLMAGFDRKKLVLRHGHHSAVALTIQVDMGDGQWINYLIQRHEPDTDMTVEFPENFNARWVRMNYSSGITATAQFEFD